MFNGIIPVFGWDRKRSVILAGLAIIASLLLTACGPTAPAVLATVPATVPAVPATVPATVPAASPTAEAGLSEQQAATLNSLKKVDDYPLYTMQYYGSSETSWAFPEVSRELANANLPTAWACSLFAAMGDASKVYGRNFDWDFSPALLLFTHPRLGYASVSMVDMAYLGVGDKVRTLTELPLDQRRALLQAPALPFDGMNERGLVVGMAAVPSGDMQPDPKKATIDSLKVIRKMLDQASTVDEALAILQRYNIDWGGGPPLHYLIADRSGRAVLVEFYQGELRLIPNDSPWHLATNFLRSSVSASARGQCSRYDKLDRKLSTAEGKINAQDAMSLLRDVSQIGTQWSIVYGMSTGDISVTMGRQYDRAHTFHIALESQ